MRARRTPPPARITGRSAEARNWRIARTSSGLGPKRARVAWCRAAVPSREASRRGDPRAATGARGRVGRSAAARIASPTAAGTSAADRGSRRRGPQGRRTSPPGRPPGMPPGPGTAARPGRSRANMGVESWRAVWMPIARLAAPTARVATAHRRPTGQLAVGLGHERRRPLVTGADDRGCPPRRGRRAGRGSSRRAR